MSIIIDNEYIWHSRKDYSMAFKLRVVMEIESGELTYYAERKKYGLQGDNTIDY